MESLTLSSPTDLRGNGDDLMQNALKAEIKRLSKKAFAKAERQKKTDQKYRARFEKRTGIAAGVPKPKRTTFPHRHFDPKFCARNANFLAKTIWHKVLTRQYEPTPAVNYQIPKPDGSKRSIMAFTIPDAALANVVLKRTRNRNTKRLSPSSYAYHPDKNVFDAILALTDFDAGGKLFAVQIDFEKYFDLIPTRYLTERLEDAGKISLTPHERHIFDRFLRHSHCDYQDYHKGRFKRRFKGTPQGSSVSLLLANVANHELDTALAAQSGKFVRFADDVVALCRTYEQAQLLERCFHDHCSNSGLKINEEKSPGITIIAGGKQELSSCPHFDYLGYRFGQEGLGVPEKVVARIKSRISRLVNIYLLQYLDAGFNSNRAANAPHAYDWDLLGLIYEMRRSLYGGLSEEELRAFIYEGQMLRKMKGLMGFYCLINDPKELRKIDGWMLSIVRRAMVHRNRVLSTKYGKNCPTPTNSQLATGEWLDAKAWRGGDLPESRVPSLVRGWRAARKHYYTFGLENVEAPTYVAYTDIAELFDY
ncbi:reverse transcriptase domain-containing protein [Ruegeria atlantica]|uniref:reverse transcriptase domain-containing protein n=1 Tax=Ruegeria atlantica TaxID=81569 RepID=UPI00147BC97C|nr:reverse transcriptase domain-containing protein [Ruegeria atlantica]